MPHIYVCDRCDVSAIIKSDADRKDWATLTTTKKYVCPACHKLYNKVVSKLQELFVENISSSLEEQLTEALQSTLSRPQLLKEDS